MKLFVVVLVIFAAIASAWSLKNPICAQEHSKNSHRYSGRTCMAYMPVYTYKMDTNECIQFIYGGCYGNFNRFITLEDCEKVCKE